MGKGKVKMIAVDEETHRLIKEEGLAELLEHHPELLKTNITMNKIIYHAVKYYIEN